MRLLHISSSPRGSDSVSITVVDAFVAAVRRHRPDCDVDTIDVWDADLPEFDGTTIGVKYKLVSGDELDEHESAAWGTVDALVARVRAADRIVLGVPMWNWSFPYKLKQFIDLVCQRGSLFTFDGRTYGPALDVERALIVAVRGQGHETRAEAPAQPADYQIDFLRFWLQVIGVRDVETLLVEHTWDEQAPRTLARGIADAEALAATF